MKSEATPVAQVAAALIPRGDRLFIAQRSPQKKFGLLWEFPGGKIEAGEDPRAALAREIREELCWEVKVGTLFQVVRYREDAPRIDLHAFWCTVVRGELCLNEHVAYRWARLNELRGYPFTGGDQVLIASLESLSRIPEEART